MCCQRVFQSKVLRYFFEQVPERKHRNRQTTAGTGSRKQKGRSAGRRHRVWEKQDTVWDEILGLLKTTESPTALYAKKGGCILQESSGMYRGSLVSIQLKPSFFENIGYQNQQLKSQGFRLNGKSMPYCKKKLGKYKTEKTGQGKTNQKGDRKCIEK